MPETMIFADFGDADEGTLLDAISRFEDIISVQRFGESESPKSAKGFLSDEIEFQRFRKENQLGYFLFGKSTVLDLRLSEHAPSHISIHCNRKISFLDAKYLIELFDVFACRTCFICDYNEFSKRNKVVFSFEGGVLESGVIREVDVNLTGVFWANYVSREIAESVELDIKKLEAAAFDFTKSKNGFTFFMYDSIAEWEENRGRLDSLCYETKGVFSRQEVEQRLSSVSSYLDATEILDEY